MRITGFLLFILTTVFLCNGINLQAQSHDWSYSGEFGPEHWFEIDPEFSSCNGKSQSPINIISSNSEDTNGISLEFHYHPFFVDLINNGHTLIEKIDEEKALTFGGISYSMKQFHFHTPSEHQIDGENFAMEIHFVHQSESGKFAVVAVLIEEGEHNNHFIQHFMKSLPSHVNEELKADEKADPNETFPKHLDKFYYYSGSFTTPPCTEGINWIVLEEPVEATKEQIDAIHEIIKDDNRPIQEVNDRVVFHSSSN
ncbi:MAG: carbonic anhydrase family protein [bacterium]|nr:carbonic anhydrase family protein [bacterium]